ncbi:MAG: zf-HC2 domain-containing protein [Chloroflexota bacterium]
MHLNDGQLRAYLDHALAESEHVGVDDHLAACAECRTRRDEIAQRAERVAASFAALEQPFDFAAEDAAPLRTRLTMTPPRIALARFKSQRERKEIPLMQKVFSPKYRLAWAMIGLVALATVSLMFPPVRAAAEGLLAQFRVSKVSVVSIDPTRLNELSGNTQISKQIGQLLSDSMTVTKQPGDPRAAANATEASKLAGFAVRLPTQRKDAPQLTVQDGGAFQLVVNRARAQAMLNDAGASNLKLPAAIDGALIKVTIPAAITAGYGQCPKLTKDMLESDDASARTMRECIVLTEIPSPTIDAPPNLDIAQLAELGLQFTGMTKEQARAYAQTVDWTSTLVIPIPRNATQYKQVSVDGVNGYLIERAVDHSQYALVWVKNGIIYAISGFGDGAAALTMANSLK